MKWEKKGLIYSPNGSKDWMHNSFLQPTPIVLEDRVRIYGGMRDVHGCSSIGFVDLNKNNLQEIIQISHEPVLSHGKPGRFDEHGVTPTAILKKDKAIYLYYAGYSQGTKIRFTVFTGLAVSEDDGKSFKRYQETPITDRVMGEELFRVIHSIFEDNGIYKVWYGAGNEFWQGENKTLAVYDIRYMESKDGLEFPPQGITAISISDDCHRVGRPFVFVENGIYKIYYGYGSEAIPYQLTYSESNDGKTWIAKDINLSLSKTGWDSQMMAYPSFIRIDGKGYLFYNGNDYGKEGFGYAELTEE